MGTSNLNLNNLVNNGVYSNSDIFYKYFISKFDDINALENNPFNSNCEICEIDNLQLPKCQNTIIDLSVLHLNIQSLPAKHSKLEILLSQLNDRKIDIQYILLCETFLNDNNSNMYNLTGYNFISRQRQHGKRGGVGIYIKNNINFARRDDLAINIDGQFESIFIEIQNKTSNNIIIGEIYRIPGTNETDSINRYDTILSKISNTNNDIIIGTDQNFDYLKLDQNKHTQELLNTFLNNAIIPTITKPTRITHQSTTLIDNIYLKSKNSKNLYTTVLLTDISDHQPICLFSTKKNKHHGEPHKFYARKLNDPALINIKRSLANTNWNSLETLDTEQAFEQFINTITNTIDQFAPLKLIIIPSNKIIQNPWITKGLMNSSKTLDKLHRLKLKNPKTDPAHDKYVNYRNYFNKLKRTTKRQYYS